jgi:rhodanese-related sulfurtransferase
MSGRAVRLPAALTSVLPATYHTGHQEEAWMGVKQISVESARKTLETSDEVVYVDVRTPQEFEAGHPPKAINIPVVLPSPHSRQMVPNPDFMSIVERHVPKGKQVILGCKMGVRSQIAAELLDSAGYTDVSNMQGGFAGARNRLTGEMAVPGWLQLDLPVETEVNASNSYEGLQKARQ